MAKTMIFFIKFIIIYMVVLHHFTYCEIKNIQGGRVHWAVYYTYPQSFILFVGLTTLVSLIEFSFDWLVAQVEKYINAFSLKVLTTLL